MTNLEWIEIEGYSKYLRLILEQIFPGRPAVLSGRVSDEYILQIENAAQCVDTISGQVSIISPDDANAREFLWNRLLEVLSYLEVCRSQGYSQCVLPATHYKFLISPLIFAYEDTRSGSTHQSIN